MCRRNQAVAEGEPHPRGGGWVGGGVRGQKQVCVPKLGPQFPAPLIDFIFLPEDNFSDVGGRGSRTHNKTQGNHEVRALHQPPNAVHAERAISKHAPPSLYKVPTYSTRAGAAPRASGGARHGGGNRAVTSQPRTGQSTSYGDVKSLYGGGQAGGTGGGARQGHPGAPPDRGRSSTDTQNAGATPRGTRASTADKEEGHSKAGEATRTAGTGNQNGADGGACAWEAATIKGMVWPASPVATGCQGNPCSTGIRWGVSPAAQMGCLRNRSGSPSGADQL